MSSENARNSRVTLATDREALVAKQSSEILRKVARKNADLRIVLPDNGKQEMKIPSAVVQLLGEIFEQISLNLQSFHRNLDIKLCLLLSQF